MIHTPYKFEAKLSAEEFQQVGRFAMRWSHMDHTIGNCLRRVLELTPEQANILIFPLSMDLRMARIEQVAKVKPFDPMPQALFAELKPLVKAMQFLRTSALHGIVVDVGDAEEPYFELRSKGRKLTKDQLFGCEDIINYTAHVATAFRFSLGEKQSTWSEGWGPHTYALPDRPPIPNFLPSECRAFPMEDRVMREAPPKSSPA
jgi:hypothetical protein